MPGYYRATKDWDFLIVSEKGNLVAAIELKSQVGSYGNNLNNRTEESLGSAEDFLDCVSGEGLSLPSVALAWICDGCRRG